MVVLLLLSIVKKQINHFIRGNLKVFSQITSQLQLKKCSFVSMFLLQNRSKCRIVLLLSKVSTASTDNAIVGRKLVMQNANVNMSQSCDKNIYFIQGNCLHTTYVSTWMQLIQETFSIIFFFFFASLIQ